MYFDNLSDLDKKIISFLSVKLYLLENNTSLKNKLSTTTFHADEANTDKELKLVIKSFLLDNGDLDINDEFRIEFKINNKIHKVYYKEINDFRIKNVILPNELSDCHKEWIKNRRAGNYVKPDLLLEIGNDHFLQYITLELKSTKDNKIPGSSIQQVDPYEWTLFVKHNSKEISITSGLYVNSITSRLPFPDRSARPEISFSNLTLWNNYNRIKENDSLTFIIDGKEIDPKLLILSDWKKSLVMDWVNYVTSKEKTNKWFDEALRMFTIELIDLYEKLSDEEKIEFKKKNRL